MNSTLAAAAGKRPGIRRRLQSAAFKAALIGAALLSAPANAAVTINCPADISRECTNVQGNIVTFTVTASSTAGSITSITCVPASGTNFPIGITTVHCTALDSLRNSATCSFTVTVRDTQPPVISVPEPMVIHCAPTSGVAVVYTVTATDNCDTNVTPVYTPASGTVFPVGTTTVRCEARDGAGNLGTNSFTVTVAPDTTPPLLTLPATMNVPCVDINGARAFFTVTATDDCSRFVNVTCVPPSGSVFHGGTNTVQCTATDAAGNVAHGSFDVVVSPDCCLALQCPPNMTLLCTPTNGTRVDFSINASSLCGDQVTVTSTPPSGSFFPPGTTPVTCVVSDTHGNQKTCAFTVTVVPDTNAPRLVLPAPITVPCLDARGAIVTYAVSASDDCTPPVSIVCTPASGSSFPIGTNIVTCTATDGAGNTTVGTFTVTVTGACGDCLQIVCPSRPIVVSAGDTGLAAVDYDAYATNTCDGTSVRMVCDPPPGSDFPIGTTTVKCTAVLGRAIQTCQFDVTVNDTTPPVLHHVSQSLTMECDGFSLQFQAGKTVYYPVTATDNATISSAINLVFSPPQGSFVPLGTHVVTVTATDAAGNSVTNSFGLTITSGPKCEVSVDPGTLQLAPDNWDFEIGLTGWTRHGDAFGNQPTLGNNVAAKRIAPLKEQIEFDIGGDYWQDLGYPIGHRGDHWIGTAENHPDDGTPPGSMQGDAPVGTLQSKTFKVAHRVITFLIGGTETNDVRVELLAETNAAAPNAEQLGFGWYSVVKKASPHGREQMRREYFDAQNYIGHTCLLRIVDDSTAGHINVDDFRFQDHLPIATTVKVGGTNIPSVVLFEGSYYDWDAPVWGFADLHTHPMSYLGFGGKIMHGKPDGPVYDALDDCNPDHGGPGPDNGNGDYYRQLIMAVMDDAGPSAHREGWHSEEWKEFRNWPVFNTIAHQQMWYQWVKRAHDGGLRVMVALCVNARLFAKATKGDLPGDDYSVGNSQIAALTNFVNAHSDFLEVAYDPFQLRDIVRRGKLAIIIGTELDDIGNFSVNDTIDPQNPSAVAKIQVRQEIQRLYDLGVRYMFPVHLVNNKFGGTAVGNMMLDISNKYANGSAFDLEAAPASDKITWKMDDFDFTDEALAISPAALSLGPALPLIAGAVADGIKLGQDQKPGGFTGLGAALGPPALIAAVGAIFLNAVGIDPLPPSIWPVGGNFPDQPATLTGHRNKMGLTPLGEYAVKEMMKRGIILDVDHMSHHTITNVFRMAESNPLGYPLNSGHNSARELGLERNENHRTDEEYSRIQKLGGMVGAGWENGEHQNFDSYYVYPKTYTSSSIPNDCAGSSKTFGQVYLYALESMHGRNVAFGTDIDGIVVSPGPRFGPQAAFGIADINTKKRDDQVRAQPANGVAYTPKHGKALTTAAFVGRSVDPDRDTDDPARHSLGYEYNQDQRDFFAALRIFYWQNPQPNDDKDAIEAQLKVIEDALSDNYPNKRRVKEYAFGLAKGVTGDAPGSDILSPDTGTREELGKAVYRYKALGIPAPDDIKNDDNKWFRFNSQCKVWNDYQKIFGKNTPMKRCVTVAKEWDVNFEGVAHYGLVPDFLQDLSNVGLEAPDMSPLFLSAEHFAQMWTKTLDAAVWAQPHFLNIYMDPAAAQGRQLNIRIDPSEEEVDVEESDNVYDPNSWRTAQVTDVQLAPDGTQVITVPNTAGVTKFYRLRKR